MAMRRLPSCTTVAPFISISVKAFGSCLARSRISWAIRSSCLSVSFSLPAWTSLMSPMLPRLAMGTTSAFRWTDIVSSVK